MSNGLLTFTMFLIFTFATNASGWLRQLVPTGAGPPFAVAELVVLAVFFFIAVKAIRRPCPI